MSLTMPTPDATAQSGTGKGKGALALGVSNRAIGPHGVTPAADGVIVIDIEGRPIGAVGVTGETSDHDEECALAGIAAAGLRAQAA